MATVAKPAPDARTGLGARAFTLIEILVVLAVISMILSLALPAFAPIYRTTRIRSATRILSSAVGKTRSTAVSTRRSCALSMSRTSTEAGDVTEKLASSTVLVAEDFERFPAARDPGDAYPESQDDLDKIEAGWLFHPEMKVNVTDNHWQIFAGETRELWAGLGSGGRKDAYAWSVQRRDEDKPYIDVETITQARFKLRRVDPENPHDEWGFGLLAHFSRGGELVGYRLCVRAQSLDSGLNIKSDAMLEKLHNPSNDRTERVIEPENPPEGVVFEQQLDPYRAPWNKERISATLAPGVWYRLKLYVKREKQVVEIAGKAWVDGSPEPQGWTVGPAYDAFYDAKIPKDINPNFQQDALAGGYWGVWASGGEVAVDDFTVDAKEAWPLPGGIQLEDVGGNFPLTFRADGTAAAKDEVQVLIKDTSGPNKRVVTVDRNTGRVSSEED
jgi:prepilin-type N-terminal cleavage/methylation domain-containing protein